MKLWVSDQGTLGYNAAFWATSDGIGCEYPDGSFIEHLITGGLWIGAIIDTVLSGHHVPLKSVTMTNYTDSLTPVPYIIGETETIDTSKPWTFRSTIHGDSGAVSENDIICQYTDTTRPVRRHIPLGIKVIQRSYAWASAVREPIIPIDYAIVNLGKKQLRDVYIGFFLSPDVYAPGDLSLENYCGYWPEARTAFVENPVDPSATPIGFAILSLPEPLQNLYYSFRWFAPYLDPSAAMKDSGFYDVLSGAAFPGQPRIKPDQTPADVNVEDLLFSFGPIENWAANETLKVSMAIVSGHPLKFGPDNLYDHALKAQTLFSRGYIPPLVLPAPKLRIEQGARKVTLRWGYDGTGVNPEQVWDDGNALAEFYPPNYWRRANPPPGHTHGGRVFEGYRLYRSEDPAGTAQSFTLLREFSVVDSVGPRYAYSTGIETTFVDSVLMPGKVYWYAVTSFGLPDRHIIDYVDRDNSVKQETLATPTAESSILASRKRVKMMFSVSNEVGKVLVVPNPYRVDQNYTTEFGGYEGRSRSWTEDKRLLKFIHLPVSCTIRIFTLAGDVVTTLRHDDPVDGEMECNLLSQSGRAIASGVYIFTVESALGSQTGKFVIIR